MDGDIYNIIPLSRCPEFELKEIHPPGEYAPSQRKLVGHKCTMKDVAEFVIEYINSDVRLIHFLPRSIEIVQALGMVATNWLIIADQSRLGILDPLCMKLAALHSDATDYPKTGTVCCIHDADCLFELTSS